MTTVPSLLSFLDRMKRSNWSDKLFHWSKSSTRLTITLSCLRFDEHTTWWQWTDTLGQLRKIVTMILEVILPLNPRGVDLYFLSREPLQHVNDPAQVKQIFSEPPGGYTPLVSALEKVFQLPATRRGHDKKQLVFIATDGAPTDEGGKETIDQLERLMREKTQRRDNFCPILDLHRWTVSHGLSHWLGSNDEKCRRHSRF